MTHRYLAVGAASFPDAIEQVGHQSKRLRRHLRSEQVATDMSGQANHQGDPKAPVQELPVNVGGASLAPGPSVMVEPPDPRRRSAASLCGCRDPGVQAVDAHDRAALVACEQSRTVP